MRPYVIQERPEIDWKVERFTPRDPIGWETPADSEPFLIREVGQYLIKLDGLGWRWDVAYLKDGKIHQVFVQCTEAYPEDTHQSKQIEWRERARDLLRPEVPPDAQHIRLKLPRGCWSAEYL